MSNNPIDIRFELESSNALRRFELDEFHNYGFYEDIGVFVDDLGDDGFGPTCREILFTRRAQKDNYYYFCSRFVTTSKIESIRFAERRNRVYIVLATDNGNKIFETVSDTSPGRPQVDTSFRLCENVI